MAGVPVLDEDAIRWSAPPGERHGRPLVVFLHGYGGIEEDWVPAFDLLPADAVGASLRGIVPMTGGRWAWFDFEESDPPERQVEAMSSATRAVLAWLEARDAPRVVLAGWSQGAALAIHLLRERPAHFAGAVSVTGFVWDRTPADTLRAVRPPVWFGWTPQDEVLPPEWTSASRDWLAAHTRLEAVEHPDGTHVRLDGYLPDAMAFAARCLATR